MNRPSELHLLPGTMRRHIPGELGPNQLAWLRRVIPEFADAERQWKASRGMEI